MAQQLVLVPHPSSKLLGAQTIGPGYSKPYTPDEMRAWAEDLDRLYRTSSVELARWRSLPRDQRPDEAHRILAVHDKYFVEAERGIKGDLAGDGRIELYGGTHRAGYLLERGIDPVPVWVSDQDPERLAAFRKQCHDEVNRGRPEILVGDVSGRPVAEDLDEHRRPVSREAARGSRSSRHVPAREADLTHSREPRGLGRER